MGDVVDLTGRTPTLERPHPIVAVIPYKGHLRMTQRLVDSLEGEGVPVIVVNNGDRTDLVNATFYRHMPGTGIHAMWNEGLHTAAKFFPGAHVAILNNDVELSNGCLGVLADYLDRRWDVLAVSPNYDGRQQVANEEDQMVHGISAGDYSGEGGIAGFAFALTARFARKWRFDEQMMWWYGDLDMALEVDRLSMRRGLRIHMRCWATHVEGGSKTGEWEDPKMVEQLAADAAVFKKKWGIL